MIEIGLLVMQWVSLSQILVSGVDCPWCRGIHLPSLHWLFEDIGVTMKPIVLGIILGSGCDCGNRNFSTPQLWVKKGDIFSVNDAG